MEIKVGEYVKLERGEIFKIDEYTTNYYNSNKEYITNEVVKHSKNIIDLIEVGDVIQLKGEEKLKYEVLKISWSKSKGKHIHIINPFRTEGGKDIFIEDIAEILTHEQYESNCYRLEEK